MPDMNNLYWGFGYNDGLYNYNPDIEGKDYSPGNKERYWAGYRCGLRDQKGENKAKYQSADYELRPIDHKFPEEK